jgi:hypothetical protein
MTETPSSPSSNFAGYALTLLAIIIAVSAFFTFPVKGPIDHSSTGLREPAASEAPLTN